MTCCKEFEKAQEPGTDNEGYGKLIRRTLTGWNIGCDLNTIDFCPWCGKKLSDSQEE